MRTLIIHHSPLPPSRNGIADYALRVIESLRPHFPQAAVRYNDDAAVLDKIPFVRPDRRGLALYQIGNNWQHTEVLKRALTEPGVVVLHDLQLYYLYESMGLSREEMQSLMARSNSRLSETTLNALYDKQPTPKLPYMLCNMLPELVARSHRIVVHSRFARRYIIRHLGAEAAKKVHVIPHFAIAAAPRDAQALRIRHGFDAGTRLIITAGFAARAKGFDLVAAAVARLRRDGIDALWVHAGDPRHGDLDLNAVAAQWPDLAGGFIATGYLDEDTLDDYVAMADILLNLRFPTVGESSGSLARALAAGACVIVSDTGSYGEIPPQAVVHLPTDADADALASVMQTLLDDDSLHARFQQGARAYARDVLGLEAYGASLAEVLHQCKPAPLFSRLLDRIRTVRPGPRTTAARTDWYDVTLAEGAEALARAQQQGTGTERVVYRQDSVADRSFIGVVRHEA